MLNRRAFTGCRLGAARAMTGPGPGFEINRQDLERYRRPLITIEV